MTLRHGATDESRLDGPDMPTWHGSTRSAVTGCRSGMTEGVPPVGACRSVMRVGRHGRGAGTGAGPARARGRHGRGAGTGAGPARAGGRHGRGADPTRGAPGARRTEGAEPESRSLAPHARDRDSIPLP